MVFLLYKHNENELLFTGVYENENDAIEIKNLHNDDSFKIVSLPFWKIKLDKERIFYNEEDNNINESDLEVTPQFRKRRRIYIADLIRDHKNIEITTSNKINKYMFITCIILLIVLKYIYDHIP
jgi:hypothetical protein